MSIVRLCEILRELRDTGPMTTREISLIAETTFNNAYHWVRRLRAEGLIEPDGHAGQAVVWKLAAPNTPKLAPYTRKSDRRTKTGNVRDPQPG